MSDKQASYTIRSGDVAIPLTGVTQSVGPKFAIQGPPAAHLSPGQPSVKVSIASSRPLLTKVRDSSDSSRVFVRELAESTPSLKLFEIFIIGSEPLTAPGVVEFTDPSTAHTETFSVLFSGTPSVTSTPHSDEPVRDAPSAPAPSHAVPADQTYRVDFGLVVFGIMCLAGAAIGCYIVFWNRKNATSVIVRPPGSSLKTPGPAPLRTPASARHQALEASPYASIHKPREQYLPPTSPAPQSPYKGRF